MLRVIQQETCQRIWRWAESSLRVTKRSEKAQLLPIVQKCCRVTISWAIENGIDDQQLIYKKAIDLINTDWRERFVRSIQN
ncbi:MAG: hypothetical protein UT11_C0020G0004 [Berkelbacteria bacterium GW2011_GWA2_38_9]|uniref:Uncharacterized protein n=1 Tax=Berkelbacteria bacterium GW2011_GWA2_38_9 TaxID=1618334 RepID=A0A0G0PK71_9BACT|nr:MAG: hypothetical protein UT11_C0020G0004 [Berkelbacteria bacterium GW2011_GWA2_38_9]